jgi:phospholipase C
MGSQELKKKLLNSVFVGAATMSLVGYNSACAREEDPVGGVHHNDRDTRSPIKHVVIIVGENRTFDHVFLP